MLPGQGWYGSTKGAIAMKSFCYDGWRQIKGTVQTHKYKIGNKKSYLIKLQIFGEILAHFEWIFSSDR